MAAQYANQLFLLALFFIMVYAVIEVLKQIVISFPDNWGKLFVTGFSKKGKRWLSFIIAYAFAWAFDFRFASLIFEQTTDSEMSAHANYFIVACLLFCGSKWVHKKLKNTFMKNIYE
jgi:hypothetical protein